MSKVDQKWYEKTTQSIGMYAGMNGWLETVIPYEELPKPELKEEISPAAFIRNPNYQSRFVPETAGSINISERIQDRDSMRQFSVDDSPQRHYWTAQHPFFNSNLQAARGVSQQGNNFWPAIQNSHFVNESRMYYKGYLANVLGLYTAYYQHWQNGMVSYAVSNRVSANTFPSFNRNSELRYLENYFSTSRYAGYGNNKKLVKTLDWKINKKGVVYPARNSGVNLVGIDLPGYEKYGDFTAWPQMVWGNLPSELSSFVYANSADWEVAPIPFDEFPEVDVLSPEQEQTEKRYRRVAADFSQFDNKYVVRQNIMSGQDPRDVRLDAIINLLGRNYPLKMYVNAAKMIGHSAIIYALLRPETKSQFEASVLEWLNRYCQGPNGLTWTSEMIQLFDNIAVCVQDLIPNYDIMLQDGMQDKIERIMTMGNVAWKAGYYGGESAINMPGLESDNNYLQPILDGFQWDEAGQLISRPEPPTILTAVVEGRNPGAAIFEILNVAMCSSPELLQPDYPFSAAKQSVATQMANFLQDELNFDIKNKVKRYAKCMIADKLVLITPDGNLMEGDLQLLKETREKCALNNYPLHTMVEIRDGDNNMTLSSNNFFIKSYWDVNINPLLSDLSIDMRENHPSQVICNLIILPAPMPVSDVRFEYGVGNPSQYANYGRKNTNELMVTAKSLMTPSGQYDEEWWNSFMSTENGFLHYFENFDFAHPRNLKKCWNIMELWETLTPETMETDVSFETGSFVRPLWATISYHEAFLKIYQGQQVMMNIGENRGRKITSETPVTVGNTVWRNHRFFYHLTGINDNLTEKYIKNDLFFDNPLKDYWLENSWEGSNFERYVDTDLDTALPELDSYLEENDRYYASNAPQYLVPGNGVVPVDIAVENTVIGTNMRDFWNSISNISFLNLNSRANRRTNKVMNDLWQQIGDYGWNAGRNIPPTVMALQDEWFNTVTENADTQFYSDEYHNGRNPGAVGNGVRRKPCNIDVFALQDWDFPVNRVFAGPKSGYKFIMNWTRILSYRVANLLSD